MAKAQIPVRTLRGVQLALLVPPRPSGPAALEPKGIVYTKRWVVELLLDLAGFTPERDLATALAVEPAAGDGAFLGPMVERLAESCCRFGRSLLDCRNALIAYELEEFSADRARALVAGILIRRGAEGIIAEQLARSWVRSGDYLLEASKIGADYVIGNPPYVRLESIPTETSSFYRQAYPTMKGRADLYIAFFEAALRQLNPNGVCAFICADRWMRNQYGAELRDLVTSSYAVEVVVEMHKADAFQNDVDAYPAITVLRRKPQERAVIASIGPEVKNVPPKDLSETLRSAGLGGRLKLPSDLRTAVVDKWFKGKDPWPCHSPEQLSLLRTLEDKFPAIESYARIGIGVATGNDAVFITKDVNLVERSRLLKLALAGDVLSGALEWSGHYLVNPWDDNGLVRLNDYPRLKFYLEQHAASLKKRHTAVKNRDGWYKTIDRVTHTLTGKLKLYIPDIKSTFAPVLDPGETYPHHNLYFIQSSKWDLEIMGGLLLSVVGQFFIESYGVRMRGGYLRFQAQYLRRIRVPHPQTLSAAQSNELVRAFRERDRERATHAALEVYGIDKGLMERALEY